MRPQGGDVIEVLLAAPKTWIPHRQHGLDLDLGLRTDHWSRDVTYLTAAIAQHPDRPRFAGPSPSRNHRILLVIQPDNRDPMVDSTATQIDLLVRVGRGDVGEAEPQQLLTHARHVVDECEPVDIEMLAGHTTEEEVHRPTAPEPYRCVEFSRHAQELGNRTQLLPSQVVHHSNPTAISETCEPESAYTWVYAETGTRGSR